MYKQANLSFSITAQAYGDDVNAIQFSTQDKNSAKLIFTIKEGKAPLNLADVDGIVDLVMGDKSVFEGNKAEITEPLEGKLEYTITPEQIRHSGKARGELKLVSKNGQAIGGFRFTFAIKKALVDEYAGPIKEFYIHDLEAIKAEIEKTADSIKDIDVVRIDTKLNELEQKVEEGGVGVDAKARQDIQSVATQLAEKANKNARFANATSKLNIVNYLGNIENIHPKALYFPNKLFGWKYWMAYTPYPGGLTEYENPCIAYSPDGVNWVEPAIGTNPLYPVPSAGGYNSDTHLVFNGTELEVWWRTLYDADSSTIYYRRKSADGITWTEPEIMFQSKLYGKDLVSPAIIFEDGKYKLWGIGNRQIRYNESANGKDWNSANERVCNTNWGNITPWHMDIIHTSKGYEAIVQGYITGIGNNNHSELYYIQSTDNRNYSDPIVILEPSTSPNAWDNQGIYRSSIVMVDDIYHIYYSAISKNNTRAISLSIGKDILDLKGYANTGTLDFSYKAKENGFHIPKVDIKLEGNSYLGTYLRASKTLPHVAQLLGEKRMQHSAGLQIGSLFFDTAEEAAIEGLPNGITGQFRRRDNYLEFFNGTGWVSGFQKPRGVKSYTAPATVDLDITDTRLIVFNGTGAITINSITGGVVHEETRLMIDSSGVTVSIPENGQIVNPGRTTITLNPANVSCNVMRMASTRWRTYT